MECSVEHDEGDETFVMEFAKGATLTFFHDMVEVEKEDAVLCRRAPPM